jgi:hypothetical protein
MMGLGRRFRRGDKAPGDGSKRASGAHGLWLRRQVRGLRPDRNPLRRRTDRVEAYLLVGLFVAAAAGAPFAARAASRATYASALRTQREQVATRHPVKAVLTQPAGSTITGYTLSVDVPTKAFLTTAAGARRPVEVLAQTGKPKGSTVTVWTDQNGNLVSPPLTAAQVTGQGDAGMIGAVAGIAVVFLTGAGVAHYALYRRRMAAWAAGWLLTEPMWNRQRW